MTGPIGSGPIGIDPRTVAPKKSTPTQPLNPDHVNTTGLVTTVTDSAQNYGNQILHGFDNFVHDPKLVAGTLMAAGAAFTLADKLNLNRQAGRSLDGASKLNGAGNILLPLAGAVAKATGHPEVAVAIQDAQDANTALKKTKDGADNVVKAYKALTDRDGAAPTVNKAADGLTKMVKAAAGMDVARGVISGVQLGSQVNDLIHDPSKIKDPQFAVGLAYNTLGTANGALAVAKLAGKTGIVSKLNPITGIAFSAVGVASNVLDIKKNGLNLDNGLGLAANSLDLVANVMMVSGVGAPIGLAIKGLALGLQVAQLGVQHWDEIKVVGAKAAAIVSDGAGAAVKFAGKAVDSAKNLVGNVASGALDGAKKLFSGW